MIEISWRALIISEIIIGLIIVAIGKQNYCQVIVAQEIFIPKDGE